MGDAEVITTLLHSFFEELEEEVRVFKEKVVLEVRVADVGVWVVNCDGTAGRVEFGSSKPSGHPAGDCSFSVDKVETIEALLSGNLKPTSAFLTRKVKYSGNLKKAQLLRVPGKRAAAKVVEEYGAVTVAGTSLLDLVKTGSKLNESATSSQSDGDTDVFLELAEVTFLNKYNAAWMDDSAVSSCSLCRTSFGVFRRKHHCRVCGRICCDPCSSQRIRNKRVCSVCFQETVLKPGLDESVISSKRGDDAVGPQKFEPEKFVDRLEQDRLRAVEAESVDSRTWRIVEASRKFLLKSRQLTAKVAELTPKSWYSRITGLASLCGQKLLFLSPFVLAWLRLGWLVMRNDRSTFGASLALSFIVATSKQSRLNFWGMLLGGGISLYPLISSSGLPLLRMATIASRLSRATNMFLLGPAVLITLANWLFGRLFQIYLVAGIIIFCYWITRKVCVNILQLSPARTRRVFESLDFVIAPVACNQILQLKSVFVKFGQYIGSRADIIPPVWNATLAKLQDDMPADPPRYVQQTVEAAFGENLWDIFEEFSFKPLASASVAQVHEAKLKLSDGATCRVAVKVQHYGIAAIMMSDFVAFSRIIDFIAWLNPDYEVAQVFLRAWKTEMLKELDFRIEADNIFTVRENLRRVGFVCDDDENYLDDTYGGSKIIVPRVIKQFVEKQCFLMSFVDGFKITDIEQLELYGVDKKALCTRIVQAYAVQLYVDGVFNADPHPGNLFVTVDKSGEVRPVLLDFGMVVRLKDAERLGYCQLLSSIAQLSVSGVAEAIKQVGYQNSQSEMHPLRDMEFFAHLLRDTGDRKTSRKMSKRFRAQRKAQRKADLAKDSSSQGRFFKQFPDSLIFLFRVLGLIRGLCAILGVEISYIELMGDYARLGLLLEKQKTARKMEQPKLKRSPSLAPTLEHRLRNVARTGAIEEDVIGLQVVVMARGKRLVELAEGCEGFDSEQRVDGSSLFPLLDLSQIMPTFAMLLLVDRGLLNLDDKISSYLTQFKSKQATVYDLLTHSALLSDAVSPMTYVNDLTKRDVLRRQCFDSAEHAGVGSSAQYKVFTFGVIAEALVEAVLKTQTLREFVQTELLGTTGDEVVVCAGKRRVLSASNQFAPMVRQFVAEGPPMEELGPNAASRSDVAEETPKESNRAYSKDSSIPAFGPEEAKQEERKVVLAEDSASGEGELGVDGNAGGVATSETASRLPPGLSLDPLMVNSETLRRAYVPSYGAFASARGLCGLVDSFLRRKLSKRLLKELVEASVGTRQEHMVFGHMDWIPGFQVLEARCVDKDKQRTSPKISVNGSRIDNLTRVKVLARFGFGGSFVLACPQRDFVVAATVNHLTLQREPTKAVISEVLAYFNLELDTDLLSGVF